MGMIGNVGDIGDIGDDTKDATKGEQRRKQHVTTNGEQPDVDGTATEAVPAEKIGEDPEPVDNLE